MKYFDVVRKAQEEIKQRRPEEYCNRHISYKRCELWEKGDQINLWTYWQGYQLKDIDKKGVDILLVGQDWGNPWKESSKDICRIIEDIQSGVRGVCYDAAASPTDRRMCKLFKAFGDEIDITKQDPGLRLFFTNYSLGYRTGSEQGGMTKSLMKKDSHLFDDLVESIHPRIIICLGRLTFEMVSGIIAKKYLEKLKSGMPYESYYPQNTSIPVYGVAHCGARGCSNVGGEMTMREEWDKIADAYYSL